MVGGFFILGLSTFSIMLAIILSAFFHCRGNGIKRCCGQ
ncbi:Permease, cytosine/purine, uracil, thiamine, allantoin family [Escherichia coli]|nr:Permease, cytosine/purine, uracil, thiamine, allantoin family [Escherichia coli]